MKEESWIPASKEPEPTLVTKLTVHSLDYSKHLEWLTRLMMAGIGSAEVLSAEIFPPLAGTTEWTLIQHFSTQEQLQVWLKSPQHQELKDELKAPLDRHEVAIAELIEPTDAICGSLSLAVVTHVRPGQEKAYYAYEIDYQSAQAQAPGFRGAYVQPPKKGGAGTWVTILRFDSEKAMNQWLSSEERKKLVLAARAFVRSTDFHNVTTSFPGWFSSEVGSSTDPANWKIAMLILLGLYPSVMLVILYLLPLMQGSSMAVNNFIGNILTVAFTTWISMPLFIKMYKSWLFPDEKTPTWVAPVSVLSIFFFFALEVAFFWRFF